MSKRIVVTLGDRVKSRREKAGLTQYELAMKAGMRPEAVSRIETGKSPASLASLHKIAPVLGTTIDELLKDESQSPPQGPAVKKTPASGPTTKKATKGKTS